MEDTITNEVTALNALPSIEEKVAYYMGLPKAVRRVLYSRLPADVKRKARGASEERRGIAFRTQDGDIVFTREEFKHQIERLEAKAQELEGRKATLAARVVEMKKQAVKFYGEEFAAGL